MSRYGASGRRGDEDVVASPGAVILAGLSVPLRLGLGGLFLLAAYMKLRPPNGPQLFSESVKAFKLGLPESLVRLSTSAVPWVEVIAALLLVMGMWVRASAAVIGALLIVFIALIGMAMARGLNLECGCFGDLSVFCSGELGWCNIVQNLVMLLAAGIIAASPRHVLCLRLVPGVSRDGMLSRASDAA